MASYEVETEVPAVVVTKELISALENYILSIAADVDRRMVDDESEETGFRWEKVSRSQVASFLEVGIRDGDGLEELSSIEEHQRSRFPNDTSRVSIEYGGGFGHAFQLRLQFDEEEDECELWIKYMGDGARELVQGILSKCISIVRGYEDEELFFYIRKYKGVLALSLIGTTCGGLAGSEHLSETGGYLILGAILLSGLPLIRVHFSSHCQFDSRSTERRLDRRKKLRWGLVGFLLFSVVGVYIRRSTLGF